MGVLFDQWRRVFDPFLLGGATESQLLLGLSACDGIEFPWAEGGVVLRRRRLYPDVLPWQVCGFAGPAATLIESHDGFPHEADMAYQYAAAGLLGNGYVSDWSNPFRLDFDAMAALIQPLLPMFPTHLTARAISGGRFRLRWEYDPIGEGAPPADFQVFAGAAQGSVDYGTPLVDSITGLAYVAATPARAFEFTTAAYSEGTVRVFGVRARSSAGVAEKNTRTSSPVKARTQVTAEIEEVSQVVQRIAYA